jgi:hypothetical protein
LEKSGYWKSGSGYVNVSRLLHRVDEALVDIETTEQVLGRALNAKLRIEGSEIGNRDDLLNKSKVAAKALIESTTQQLPSQGTQGDQRSTDIPFSETIETRARMAVREISADLHKYQDALWEGLVRRRMNLMTTAFVTGCTLYVLLQITLLSEIQPLVLVEVTLIYFVGALVGLCTFLYDYSRSSRFGIPPIHGPSFIAPNLLITPLLSGNAAIGGTVIIHSIVLSIQGGSLATTNLFPLNPFTFLVAAIFGLTPNLILKPLQKRINQYQASLKSTESH